MAVFRSKVSRAMSGTTSVRCTIPEAVAALLGAEPGTVLLWTVEPGSGKIWVSLEAEPKKRSKD